MRIRFSAGSEGWFRDLSFRLFVKSIKKDLFDFDKLGIAKFFESITTYKTTNKKEDSGTA